MAVSSPSEAGAPVPPIALIDLKAQQARIRGGIERAIQRVLDHGHYIIGPEVDALEKRLWCSAPARKPIGRPRENRTF